MSSLRLLFSWRSLLTGVEASAAQKQPVTKTCLQCGAILASNVRACSFCDSPLGAGSSALNPVSVSYAENARAHGVQGSEWRGELADRVQAYRTRRRKSSGNVGQSRFSFESHADAPRDSSLVVAEPSPSGPDDFSFTIAIGRHVPAREDDARITIDVSADPGSDRVDEAISAGARLSQQSGLYPVANIDDRRLAAFIDAACLMFAYGGFLALFGSLGGQFTLSKISAAVYVSTFAIVYLQYFALFTIFGGTTPGMMLRGLQVVSFSGEPPDPRQMLLRALGYMLSAGTFFLGFLWAWWDEDALTWHDRISRTYLASAETYANAQISGATQSR